jgi:hypothetical protein
VMPIITASGPHSSTMNTILQGSFNAQLPI